MCLSVCLSVCTYVCMDAWMYASETDGDGSGLGCRPFRLRGPCAASLSGWPLFVQDPYPKGPCTQIVCTFAQSTYVGKTF